MRSVIHLITLDEISGRATFSGAESHLFILLPALAAAGWRVELALLVRNDGPAIAAKTRELQAAGIAVTAFRYRRFPDPACLAALTGHLRARRDWIVHTHLDDADGMGKLAARLAGGRIVIATVHNDEPGHLRLKWRLLLTFLDRLTTHYIAISEAVRRHLVERERVLAEKVTVVPYGVPEPARVEARAELRARLGLPADRRIVGFVGRLTAQKNLGVLLAAMAQLPEMVCVLIGGGELRGALEQQAAGLDNVRFLGYRPEAAALMPAFDVFCLPSRWEGLGLVLVEAMLRRVPIVGSRAGAIPEVLGQGRYGLLFEPDDVAGLVNALRAAPEAGQALIEPAWEHARSTYTVAGMVRQTLAVYARWETRA